MASPAALESVQQLAAMWRVIVEDYGTRHPDTDVRDLSGMAIRWADSKFAFWNCITFTNPSMGPRSLEMLLSEAAHLMREKRERGLIWLFEDLLTPEAQRFLPDLASQAGLSTPLPLYGMAGAVLPMAIPDHPSLEFVRVTSAEALNAYADINSEAYGFPLEAGRDGLEGSRLWQSDMHAYLGVHEGRPVSAAAVGESGGALFLALVATRPEAQRRGYGEATVRKALFEAGRAAKLSRSVLHATEAGAPVYARIGYRRVATISAYGLAD
jgi:GNAT superfamily N-acetyltransferase